MTIETELELLAAAYDALDVPLSSRVVAETLRDLVDNHRPHPLWNVTVPDHGHRTCIDEIDVS